MKESYAIVYTRLVLFLLGDLVAILILFGYVMVFHGHLPYPVLFFLVGVLGGLVSIYQRLDKFEESQVSRLASNWFNFLIIPVMGGVFALIMLVMLLANLIAGEFFPRFVIEVDNPETGKFYESLVSLRADFTSFAKSIFWAFLAGFSERLIFTKLLKFEALPDDRGGGNGKGEGGAAEGGAP